MLLGSPLVIVPRVAVLRIATWSTALTLLIVAASPFVAFALLKRGVENNAAYARLLMAGAEREWRDDDRQAAQADRRAVRAGQHGGVLRQGPAVDLCAFLEISLALGRRRAHRARRHGDHVRRTCRCAFTSWSKSRRRSAVGRRADVTLTRRWLGFESAPRRSSSRSCRRNICRRHCAHLNLSACSSPSSGCSTR